MTPAEYRHRVGRPATFIRRPLRPPRVGAGVRGASTVPQGIAWPDDADAWLESAVERAVALCRHSAR